MPKLNMAVSHSLTQEEAIKRIMKLLDDTKTKFSHKISDLHEEWDGHTGKFNFSAMGFPVSGTLTVKATQVHISGNLPFAAMLFRGKIESTIKHRAETLLV
jgi:hypothetical protein